MQRMLDQAAMHWSLAARREVAEGEDAAKRAIEALRSGEASAEDLQMLVEHAQAMPDESGARLRWRAFCRALAVELGAKR
ncbi:MAG: hypothetical protein AB1430_17300 [Pseudomonadota bacterium]